MSIPAPFGKSSPVALVLSGGGARAAYQVGVLIALAEQMPGLVIPIITGVSAGAINAAYLAGHTGPLPAAIAGLRAEWTGLTSDRVYGIFLASIVRSAAHWITQAAFGWRGRPPLKEGLLDTRPLRTSLGRSINFGGIEENIQAGRLRAVALNATSYASGWTVTFVHGDPDIPMWRRSRRVAVRARITLDHVMASSSLPIVFPAIRLNGEYFGDGSLRRSSPLAPAIHLGARKILAIAAGPIPSVPDALHATCEYPTAAEALGLLMNSTFLDDLEGDTERLELTNKLLAALPPSVPPPEGLRPIDLLVLRPSRDLGSVAGEFTVRLPKTVSLLVRAMGGLGMGGRDFLSYLLFEPAYTTRLVELGYTDTQTQRASIEAFFLSA